MTIEVAVRVHVTPTALFMPMHSKEERMLVVI